MNVINQFNQLIIQLLLQMNWIIFSMYNLESCISYNYDH